jgi:hypothetical protein
MYICPVDCVPIVIKTSLVQKKRNINTYGTAYALWGGLGFDFFYNFTKGQATVCFASVLSLVKVWHINKNKDIQHQPLSRGLDLFGHAL